MKNILMIIKKNRIEKQEKIKKLDRLNYELNKE